MKEIKRVLLILAALSCLVMTTQAQAKPKPKEAKTTYARDVLQPYVDNGQLAGAISVFYKDGVQETCCIGYADVAAKRRIKMDDVFMQCSQTKGFCGVTIAKLVEEGKISLDDPVSKYLPEFASAGAGLWTTANDQLKFYKMLMNLGVGDNGVRILKEETVKSILAVTTRPENMGGYSLGLSAPKKDDEEAWFGHGGAWGTNCMVNWHKKELRLWVIQSAGGKQPWSPAMDKAANKFFAQPFSKSGAGEYTGRLGD